MTLERLKQLAQIQARDPGLWVEAETVTEDYLQAALQVLHKAIEGLE